MNHFRDRYREQQATTDRVRLLWRMTNGKVHDMSWTLFVVLVTWAFGLAILSVAARG